jgi:hypothetical protein
MQLRGVSRITHAGIALSIIREVVAAAILLMACRRASIKQRRDHQGVVSER